MKRTHIYPLITIIVFITLYLFIHRPKIEWQNYSDTILQYYLSQDRTVMVYFTAESCMACQINEKMFNESIDIPRTLNRNNIKALYADLGQPGMEDVLKRLGHTAVPILVIFHKLEEPIIFTDVLNEKELVKFLKTLK